ncbi:uncharacterized protein LOC143185118 [Calliopsis andreniformis]|uniref:uncharacterized protein LOC143185118 n=1 Tax=Calliopsis andreniformis TaxID=337506 RepID=UPI003FCD0C1E
MSLRGGTERGTNTCGTTMCDHKYMERGRGRGGSGGVEGGGKQREEQALVGVSGEEKARERVAHRGLKRAYIQIREPLRSLAGSHRLLKICRNCAIEKSISTDSARYQGMGAVKFLLQFSMQEKIMIYFAKFHENRELLKRVRCIKVTSIFNLCLKGEISPGIPLNTIKTRRDMHVRFPARPCTE